MLVKAKQIMRVIFRDSMDEVEKALGFEHTVRVRFLVPDIKFLADFAIPEARIIVECDESNKPDEELYKHGWIILCYPSADIINKPKKIRAKLLRYLTAYGRSWTRMKTWAKG